MKKETKDELIKFLIMLVASLAVSQLVFGNMNMNFLQRWTISMLTCGVVDNFIYRSKNKIDKYKEAE